MADNECSHDLSVAPSIGTDHEVYRVSDARRRDDRTEPINTIQIADSLRAPPDPEHGHERSAQAHHVCGQERSFVLGQNEITASYRSVPADGVVVIADLDHLTRALVSSMLLAWEARGDPALAEHPGSFEKPGHLKAEQVMDVS